MHQPNSTVILLSSIRLKNDYKDTIYFSDRASQVSFFSSKAVATFENLSYQRKESGVLRIQGNADDFYNCNYMMFRNTNYSGRWFYAFVNEVRYVNDSVFEILYEIDVIQTWLLDVNILPCFIERTHTPTDIIGEHLVVEPVNIGELKCTSFSRSGFFDRYKVVCAYAPRSSN